MMGNVAVHKFTWLHVKEESPHCKVVPSRGSGMPCG